MRENKSGAKAIVPGDPDSSELLKRLDSPEEEELMPPPWSHKPLKASEKSLLRRWIKNGVPFEPHWAFVPPARPSRWGDRNAGAIDTLVREGLHKIGLAPAPEADRATLIRRVTLDLTELPPTPAEQLAFFNNTHPYAYEQLVDRLMNTRAYAERWARDWLDLARYADTCGFADDLKQDIWPYRDWVVEALHQNIPYDRFTIEQLAGDMLPGATQAQRIATGFHRNAPQAKGMTYPVEEYRLNPTSRTGEVKNS